jgi:hypothetical protein
MRLKLCIRTGAIPWFSKTAIMETRPFPGQTCPDSPDRYIPDCGDGTTKRGITCSSLWNFTVSNVRVLKDYAKGKDQNPTDPDIIETICFIQDLDDWFRNKDEADNFPS